MAISVYILDDHEIVRRGLTHLLRTEDDITIVGGTASATRAVQRIRVLRPDVAILDVRVAGGSGISVCREIRSSMTPTPACLMLTSYPDDEAVVAAIMAGAAGYVLKQITGIDLIAAVRTVAAGGSLLDPTASAAVMARMRDYPLKDPVDVRYESLSLHERRILALIATGMTNKEISVDLGLGEKAVRGHVSRLLRKLGFARRTEAAVFSVRRSSSARTYPF
ncbi:MAG TPA: response regulator transcription factor [Pseudonocardiaceae bacterium]